jgi:SpoVK/Ycf46/Vps4 family AAA+-type ATPase
MSNKNNKTDHLLNPYKIDIYNKFLITLDKYNTGFKESSFFTNNATKEETKQILKDSEDNFNDVFDTPLFTGHNSFDSILLNAEINNLNVHTPLFLKNPNSIKRTPTPKNELIVKKQVIIEKEVNTVSDMLELIETYKLDPEIEYNINMKALHNMKDSLIELNNMIGMKEIKTSVVDQILYFVQHLHKSKNGEGDFMHTVIYGPPGTGKTEVAKIMGKLFCKMGVLEKDKFLKVTRADLIAGYLGQTAIKTKDVIKDALGGVLFIDEAYSLGNPEKRDSFSKECIDTLCEALSDHKEKLMVIIAGYEEELKECFFNYNKGLDSRFTWRFKTEEYTPQDLYEIFLKKVKDAGWEVEENTKINSQWFKNNMDYLKFFGRDIETILSKTKIAHSRRVFCKPDEIKKKITMEDLENGFQKYINNSDVKKRKESEYLKKQVYGSMYC